jgi:inositol 1,4,5-triphosphate receptor type 1/inositol 1,4,5-triphosphate receptor type 3
MMIDDINVQSSLAELLDNNYYAIQRFISRNSIKRIVEIMKGQIPHEKYLKILSSICVCKGKSITNN